MERQHTFNIADRGLCGQASFLLQSHRCCDRVTESAKIVIALVEFVTVKAPKSRDPFVRNQATWRFRLVLSRELSLLGEGRANTPANDRIFAWLQHPDPDDQRICIRRYALIGFVACIGIEFN
jgi:hypothetical protein